MSKKILKRSLALGALMAFVITGSAMFDSVALAADITKQEEANNIGSVIDGQIITVEGSIVITKDTLEINNTKGFASDYDDSFNIDDYDIAGISSSVYHDDTSAKIEIHANEMTINSDGLYGVASGGLHNLTNAVSVVDLGIETDQIGILKISTPNGYGITTNGRNGTISKVNVFAEELTIESGKGAIRTWRSDGGVSLGSETTPIDQITLVGKDSETVRAFAGSVEIYGNDVTLDNKGVGKVLVATNTNVDLVANDALKIVGDIEAVSSQAGSGSEDVMVNINKDNNDAKVEIVGNIKAYKNGGVSISGVNLNLGAEGSYFKGKIEDDNQKSTLSMNPGTIWEITDESEINKVIGNQGVLKVNETGKVLAEVTNGQDAKNFTLMGSQKASESLDGDNLAVELNDLAETVTGITFARYEFEEGAALGAIEAYQENGEWKITERTNVTNSNISDVAALGLMAWRAENNDMNKRLGELRNSNGEHGVWVRMVRGETEYEAVKNQYNTYQLGYDEKLSVDKSWTVGMALTYTDGESSFNGGSGENKHKGLAIYGSKLNDDGSFVDLIAKYARLDHDVEVGTEKGDYEANGYSVSAEYGKRFQQGNGLWVEPQVELTYGKVGSADYMIGKNRAVTHEGMESLVGRIGFSLGKDIKQGNVYARASYLYDFEGETEASYTDAIGNVRNINDDLGGGWWEVGVGANINLSKATYIYADVEKTFGGEVDTNWQWNLGVRYSF